MAKLGTILDQVDAGTMLLPEFQRGYVWNRDQVRGLMRSLYHGYPVGALLVWETDTSTQAVRGGVGTVTGTRSLLLDGQQRITTLYGIVRGRPPAFFEGDPATFDGLRFNVETEAFEFYGPIKMKDDPRWIDVTALFVDGTAATYTILNAHPVTQERFSEYVDRVQRLRTIVERVFHVEAITGADKSVDVVVDIFNRVNSGGTKLSKGDLALARICSEWTDARPTMRRNLDRWAEDEYHFSADWLLRNVNAIATGRAPFSALEDVSADGFRDALFAALHNIDHFVFALARGRLGLDHDRVLMGRAAVPVIARHLHNRGGRFADGAEADRALYWYVLAFLRGRFATSSDTTLNKDLDTVDAAGIDGLITALGRARKGNLTIDAQDFEGLGRASRPYPLLYMLTRVTEAPDLVTGRVLGRDAATIQVHEIFPKPLLLKARYPKAEINAIANFAFVTPSTATSLARLEPAQYLGALDPAVLRAQWIPADPRLWAVENYRAFLDERRAMLAEAANTFLAELAAGTRPWQEIDPIVVSPEPAEPDARAAQLAVLVEELVALGCTRPSLDTEVADPDTGRPLATVDAYWPEGLQPGQGAPVVLGPDQDSADLARLTELGIAVFTSADALRGYVQRTNAVAAGTREDAGAAVAGDSPDEPVTVLDVPAQREAADVTAAFEHEVRESVRRSKAEVGYNPRSFAAMIGHHGPLGAVRKLLAAPGVHDGFVRLWEEQRLDLTVEALAADPRFASLFSETELAMARARLGEYGYRSEPDQRRVG